MASGKKAIEAVLFSVTSELSWATCCEQGDTESWDLLGPQSWLPGVSRVARLQPLRSLSSHWCFEGPPARRASASTKGLGASAALLRGLAGQGASQRLDMWGLNLPPLPGDWSLLGGQGDDLPSHMPADGLCGLMRLFCQTPARHLPDLFLLQGTTVPHPGRSEPCRAYGDD